jgi:hypothetical protein
MYSRLARIVSCFALPALGLAAVGGCSSGDVGTNDEPVIATAQSELAGAPTKALMLIDSQLYALLKTEVDKYLTLAEQRRGFTIALKSISGLDAMTPKQVRDYVISQRSTTPGIEGVLFIGNVKLPSFYKNRADDAVTRIAPIYLQDLDASFTKHYADGVTDPVCNGTNEPYCVVSPRADGTSGAVVVPRHDFDRMARGTNPDPEIWAAFMPVGVSGTSNTYTDFANQLRPYLNKVISFYQGTLKGNGKYYLVSNDKGETFDITWNTFGKSAIDFYGKPGPSGQTGTACISGTTNYCYARWPLENYSTYANFASVYDQKWVGEGWQTPSIFMNHMNNNLYDVAEVNVHSTDTMSLVTASQAKTITKAGLIVALDGCNVAAFAQPNSPSNVDNPTTLVSNNIMAAYLYGSSKALASLGDPTWRGHYAHFPTMYSAMKVGKKYLGAANFDRMKKLYSLTGDNESLMEQTGEMLMGDPFMDLNPTTTCTAETNTAFCSRLGKNCGSVTGTDNCGQSRTVSSCGTCTSPQTCGGGGTQNVCGSASTSCWTAYSKASCGSYALGTKVSRNGRNWECTNGNCANCSWQTTCEPGNTGCPWGTVWTDRGVCN